MANNFKIILMIFLSIAIISLFLESPTLAQDGIPEQTTKDAIKCSSNIALCEYVSYDKTMPIAYDKIFLKYKVTKVIGGAKLPQHINVIHSFGDKASAPKDWKFSEKMLPVSGSKFILFLQEKALGAYEKKHKDIDNTEENLKNVIKEIDDFKKEIVALVIQLGEASSEKAKKQLEVKKEWCYKILLDEWSKTENTRIKRYLHSVLNIREIPMKIIPANDGFFDSFSPDTKSCFAFVKDCFGAKSITRIRATQALLLEGKQPDPESKNAKQAVTGKKFISVKYLDIVVSPRTGKHRVRSRIIFKEDGKISWIHSDCQESGSYECEGWDIKVKLHKDELQCKIDPKTGFLIWRGNQYYKVISD